MRNASHTGRMSFLSTVIYHLFAKIRLSAVLLAAVLQYPAFFSCQRPGTVSTRFAPSDHIDVFFFDTISPQYLDSYQRLKASDALYALSSVGPKRIVALSVRSLNAMDWAGIRTYADLCKYSFCLKDDTPDNPLLAGETLLDDGVSRIADIPMNTSLARIVLNTLSCDFTYTPYPGQGFYNKLIYLQYAGVEAHPFGPDSGIPVSVVNPGWLDSAAVMSFPHPEMLLQNGLGNIWRERREAGNEFWCYANDVEKAGVGRPVTRLVLEGNVGENHCYYPIELPGLKAGHTYYLDVSISRIGTTDPDIPASGAMLTLESSCAPWTIAGPREEIY